MIKLIQNGKFVRKGQVINRYFWIVLRFDKLSVSSTVTNMSLLCALKWVFSNTHFEALLSTMTKIYEWSQFPITWRKLNFSKENWRILFSVEVDKWQWYLTMSNECIVNLVHFLNFTGAYMDIYYSFVPFLMFIPNLMHWLLFSLIPFCFVNCPHILMMCITKCAWFLIQRQYIICHIPVDNEI